MRIGKFFVLPVLAIGIIVAGITGGANQALPGLLNQACSQQSTSFNAVQVTLGSASSSSSPEQQANAKIIIGVGLARGRSQRDIKIALMTALQESGLRNLPYGDRDSLGLFQQRPSVIAWGTASQIMDPTHASNKFYEALERVTNRDSMPLGAVAEAVQRPAAGAYQTPGNSFMAKEPAANALLAGNSASLASSLVVAPAVQFSPSPCSTNSITAGNPSSVEIAVQAALAEQGKPYQWGSGPSDASFDCSDLMQFAFAKAAVKLPRVASAQYSFGVPVPKPGSGTLAEWLKVLQRGDLIYWTNSAQATSPSQIVHVAMYLGNAQMIDAPRSGKLVGVKPIYGDTAGLWFFGASRPISTVTTALASSINPALVKDGWQAPLKTKLVVTSPFGMRVHPITGILKLHDGTDFAAATGTPVYAANSGTVSTQVTAAVGLVVTIDHGGGVITKYEHLSRFVLTGPVQAGQLIALSGSTGQFTTGPHLHFTVEVDGKPVNPIDFMRQHGLTL